MNKFESYAASLIDRENLVYEINYEDRYVAEVSKEPGKNFEVEMYTPDAEEAWYFELDEFLALLNEGREALKNNA